MEVQFNQNGTTAANDGFIYTGSGSISISGSDSGNPEAAIKFCDGEVQLFREDDVGEGDSWFKMYNAAAGGLIQISASAAVVLQGGEGSDAGISVEASNFIVMDANDTTIFWVQDENGCAVVNERLGVNIDTPLIGLDVHYSGTAGAAGRPETLSNDTGGGEVVYFGTASAGLSTGGIYFLNEDGGWQSVDASVTGSGHNQLMGIALGAKPAAHGILIKGFFDVHTFYSGSFIKGGPMYIQSSSVARTEIEGGCLSGAAPAESDSYVRVVGYGTDTPNVIYFNPDSTYIELS
jgi:hypothetical protein